MTTKPLNPLSAETSFRLRPVRKTDAEPLRTHTWPDRSFMVIYNLIARAARLEKEGRGIGLVLVTDEDQAVGYGQLTLWPNVAEISDLVVAQNLRGRGLGTALIQMLVRQGRALGAHEFEIGAALTNPRAVTLYRRLGFLDSHTILTHTDGKHEKVLYLRLTLGQAQREPARNG